MNKRIKRVLSVLLAACVIVVAGWEVLYPSFIQTPGPKSLTYLLWKRGLYNLNLEVATGVMVGDSRRDKLVVGQTRAQLERRFGHLFSRAEATSYQQRCSLTSGWDKRDVLFIGTPAGWMVAFDQGTATDLVLLKPC